MCLSDEVKKGMTEKVSQYPYGYLNVREVGRSIIKLDPHIKFLTLEKDKNKTGLPSDLSSIALATGEAT